MKNTFIVEEETVNVGSKFTIGDTAQEQAGQHTQRQCTRPSRTRGSRAESARGRPRVRGEAAEALRSVGSSRALSPFSQLLVSFSTPDLPGDPLGEHTRLSQDGSRSEGFWEEQDLLWPNIIP